MAEGTNAIKLLLEAISEKFGYEVGAFVQQQINEILALENVDVNELRERINTISRVLDGDTDDEYSVENIIKILSDNSKAIAEVKDQLLALEQQVDANAKAIETLNADETVEGSVDNKIKKAKDELNTRIDAVEQTANDAKTKADEAKAKAEEALEKSTAALNKAGNVGSKEVDESNIGNGKVLAYNVETGKVEYVEMPAPGAVIDDHNPSETTTYSSAKIEQIKTDLQAQINDRPTIDDTVASDAKVWSSAKTASEIQKASDKLQSQIDANKEAIDKKVDQATYESDKAELHAELDAKVDRSEIESISCADLAELFRLGLQRGAQAVKDGTYKPTDCSTNKGITEEKSDTSSDGSL